MVRRVSEQDWGWDEGWREGEGALPYLGPRHLRTSGMHLQLRGSYSGRQEWFLTGLGVGQGSEGEEGEWGVRLTDRYCTSARR